MTKQRPPRVFISYSHDTVKHQERVLGLADRLRADGIDAEVDQYNAAPPEGWPLWCERQIDAADLVLMVCTETYHRRVKGDEEWGKGLGVVWEARIIRQLLYDAGAISDKFVPVLFSDTSPEQIPTPIKGWTRYVVDAEDGYENLYRRLSGQPRLLRPALGTIRPLPTRRRQWSEGTMETASSSPVPASAPAPDHAASVFISWSGDVSYQVGKALHEWLPNVLQAVRPWMSTDIAVGARWSLVLHDEPASNLGILCLTRGNLTAPWLLFEAGVLAKHLTVARVIPYRFQLKADEIAPPLSQFQSVGDDEAGTWCLLQTINMVCNTPLKDEQLWNAFKIWWPKLNRRLRKITTEDTKEAERLRQCEKDLRSYPRGPAVDDAFLPHSFVKSVADTFHEKQQIMQLVGAANALRQAADPSDSKVTVISPSYLVMNDTAYAAWHSVFKEARLNSPRMLASILMVLPIEIDTLKQERDSLLVDLKENGPRTSRYTLG